MNINQIIKKALKEEFINDSCVNGSCGKQNVGDFKIPYCNTKA